MFRRCFCCSSSSKQENEKIHLTKFQVIKLLTSLALPLAVAIFTLITTVQNRHIAHQNREQDLMQAEDNQRQDVFINYINDISRYRDKNVENLSNNSDKLLYIRTKTLTALRKLDNERKKYLLLFLQESSLLSEDELSLLVGAVFNGIKIHYHDCVFRNVIFVGVYFENVTFTYCIFENVTFRYVKFQYSILTNSVFYLTSFISCQMEYVNLENTIISESEINNTLLGYANFQDVKLDFVKFNNVNLTRASFSKNATQTRYISIRNSMLPNGTFSSIDDIISHSKLCQNFDHWSLRPSFGIKDLNCTFVATIAHASISKGIILPFLDRSVLIDADQADFLFEIEEKYTRTSLTIAIYFVGVENGVFAPQQFGRFFQ